MSARMRLSILLCAIYAVILGGTVSGVQVEQRMRTRTAEERWEGEKQIRSNKLQNIQLVQLDQRSKDDTDPEDDAVQQEAVYAYASQLNDDDKDKQAASDSTAAKTKKPAHAKFQSDEEESMAIAGYSMEIAQGEAAAATESSGKGDQSNGQKKAGKSEKPTKSKQKDAKKGGAADGEEDDPENLQLSLSESILNRNKKHDDIMNDDDDDDDSSNLSQKSKSKKSKPAPKPMTDEEKQNILFWSNQDPEAKAEKKRKEEEERLQKRKEEEEEQQQQQNMQALSQLPYKERQRLQHEALVEAETQVNEEKKEQSDNPNELTDLDESASEIDSWDKTEQFSKYMEKNALKAQEKFIERKFVNAQEAKALVKSKEQVKKEQAAKSLDDDVESVQQLYDQENQKEQDLFQKQTEIQGSNSSSSLVQTGNTASDQHPLKSEDYDKVLSTHATDKEPEDPFAQKDQQSESQAATPQAAEPEKTEQPAESQPTPVLPKDDQAAKKSFFEAIWERDHPEDVKKMKLEQEKKKVDEEAKRLQDEAKALVEKSQKLKDSIKLNKTKNEEDFKKKEVDRQKMEIENQKKAKAAEMKNETTDKKVARLLSEGKSLGEIQHELQAEKPYYIQAQEEEKNRIANEEKKEMDDYMKNPLKDETQELIDTYAKAAEERTRVQQEKEMNATIAKQKNERLAAGKKVVTSSSKPPNINTAAASTAQSSPNKAANLQAMIQNKAKLKIAVKPTQKATDAGESPQNNQNVDLGDGNMSEADVQAATEAIIEEKKQQKFNKLIEKGSKIAAQQQENVMSQLIGKSFSQNQPENSEQNTVTRAVLQTSQDVEKDVVATEPAAIPDDSKLVEQQAMSQEDIINQLVQQQADQNQHQIEAEVAAQMQVQGGMQDIIQQQVQKQVAVQVAQVQTSAATPAVAKTETVTQNALKDDSRIAAQVQEKQAEQEAAESAKPAPKPQAQPDESDSYLEKLAKDKGIDLETASVEQLQQLMKSQNDQQKPNTATNTAPAADPTPQPIEKQITPPVQEQAKTVPQAPVSAATVPIQQEQVQIADQSTADQTAATTTPISDTNGQSYEHIKELGTKLGIEVPPEIMQLQTPEAISETLVSVALQAGKSEEEIAKVLGS